MTSLNKHVCEGCCYWRNFSAIIGATRACHFMYDEGEPRGIPIEACASGADGSRRKDAPKTNRVRPMLAPRQKGGGR